MDSVEQTLKRAREVDQKYKQFLARKVEQDRSMDQTMKRIDKAQETLKQTKTTIGTIDNLYDKLQKTLSDMVDNAVSQIQKTQLITVADPGFQPSIANAKKVATMLKDKKKIMILTGAGISAASGIPTFRGKGGFWNQKKIEIDPNDPAEKIDPRVILTKTFYNEHPSKTWEWLKNFYELKIKSKPNKGHIALAEIIQNLRGRGKEVCLVTQNIDNFHKEAKAIRLAKNKNMKDYPIYEIHGNILKMRCDHCSLENKKLFQQPFQSYIPILEMKAKFYCPKCEGPLRPHIMFFDEFYDEVFNNSTSVEQYLKDTDAILVIGTALETGLANSIVALALQKGKQVVEINPACQIRKSAVWWMQKKAEQILQELKIQMIRK